jgi:hypothetical protein
VKNGGERRVYVVGLACSDDPIDGLCVFARQFQKLRGGLRAQRAFVFVFAGVSQGMNSGALL